MKYFVVFEVCPYFIFLNKILYISVLSLRYISCSEFCDYSKFKYYQMGRIHSKQSSGILRKIQKIHIRTAIPIEIFCRIGMVVGGSAIPS